MIDREMQRYRDAKDKAAAAIEVYNEYTEADATFSEEEWKSWNREFEENSTKAGDKISKVLAYSLTTTAAMDFCSCNDSTLGTPHCCISADQLLPVMPSHSICLFSNHSSAPAFSCSALAFPAK